MIDTERNNVDSVAAIWDDTWKRHKKLPKQYGLSRLIFRILKKEIEDINCKKILEAGSGTGLVSLKLAQSGSEVTLLDISPNAIDLSKRLFKTNDQTARFACASVFKMPFEDQSFDVVWNAGVVEHYDSNDQLKILSEMKRVCKKNGNIILLNPNDKAKLYKISKNYADKKGLWGAGDEYPVISLKPLLDTIEYCEFKEYSVGFLQQLNFVGVFFSKYRLFRLIWIVFYTVVQRVCWFLDYLPGYLLVTVIKT